jgi:acetyl-CoA carboxylase biotin carboxyl carrier protein
MKVKDLIELMSFISESELNEVKIETEEVKIAVKKAVEVETRFVEHATPAVPASLSVAPAPSAPAPMAPIAAPVTDAISNVAAMEDKYITIKSPMIGTFYRSSNPETPYFCEVGDTITSGSPVCIIEAMKLFNEIESEISGTIVKVLVENATPVEFDQPLFVIDPS